MLRHKGNKGAQERGHASKIYIRSYYSFADFLKYIETFLNPGAEIAVLG